MARLLVVFLAAAVLAPVTAVAQPASLYSGAVVTGGNTCLIPDTRRELRAFACTSGSDRYLLGGDGVVRTRDGYCWDHGVPAGADLTRNNAVHLVKCHGGKSQVWYFTQDARALVQSAANSAACITVEGDQVGARAVVSQCAFSNPPRSQQFYRGWRITTEQRAMLEKSLAPATFQLLAREGAVTFSNGARMVAAGGGNMVAAGGGNMVAAGGGNILPSGAGNVLPSGAGGFTDAVLRSLFANATPVRGR